MSRPIRLGAVSYLNVRPLVYGLEARRDLISLRFDVPSTCARLLADGQIDLGMVPSISWIDRPGDRIVPGVCIGSEGPVASVALFARKPMADIRTIALDTSSRTSAALVKVLCARRFDIAPGFIDAAPDLSAMLAVADAALLIGDPALFVDHRAHGAEKIDLGGEWTAMTGLPFVWAFWSGPAGAIDAPVADALVQAAHDGMAHANAIAAEYCASHPERIPMAERYLRDNLRFDLSPRAIEGLETYYREAAAVGVVAGTRPLEFFEKERRS
jgi:predicted solute-binding protein